MALRIVALAMIAVGALNCGASSAAEPASKILAEGTAKAEKRFAEIRPKIRAPMADAIVTNFGFVKKIMNGEKLFAFDEGMVKATAAQHQEKPGCLGLAQGLLCEIDSQMSEALAEVSPQKSVDCAKSPTAPECKSKAATDPDQALKDAMKKLEALSK
jgi:hypothetical protein